MACLQQYMLCAERAETCSTDYGWLPFLGSVTYLCDEEAKACRVVRPERGRTCVLDCAAPQDLSCDANGVTAFVTCVERGSGWVVRE